MTALRKNARVAASDAVPRSIVLVTLGLIALLVSTYMKGRALPATQEPGRPNPVAVDEPLPDVATLLAEVKKNQKAIDKILENYTYTKLEEEVDLDSRGQIKSKHVREYEIFYVNGREVQKLVARDGRSLSPKEKDKELERVKKRVQEYTSAGSSRNEEYDEDELHISTFLRAARFTHPRRESFGGQPVFALDIEPNPGYHPQNLNERLVQNLEGTMLVDERAHQVVRLQARLSSTAKIAGGLMGSIERGSGAVFEQALVNNEVWLPSYLEEHFSGRGLLFWRYRIDFVVHYKEYKKFRVETYGEIGSPKPN